MPWCKIVPCVEDERLVNRKHLDTIANSLKGGTHNSCLAFDRDQVERLPYTNQPHWVVCWIYPRYLRAKSSQYPYFENIWTSPTRTSATKAFAVYMS